MADFQTPPSQGVPQNNTSNKGSRTGGRKYTPYRKTPRTRRITGQQTRLSKTPHSPEDNALLDEIPNKTWWAYKVSPLYQFSHSPNDLKAYSKLLGAYLEAESVKGTGFETEQADKAVFSVLRGLGNKDEDKEAVKITIKSKPNPSTGEQKDAVVAILCSVDIPTLEHSNPEHGFTMLPVLITRGPSGLTSLMLSWLKAQFDCHISHMTFSSFDLSWMVAIWAGSGTDKRGAKPIELVYAVPKECEFLKRITLSIEPQDCERLWSRIHDTNLDEFTAEEVAIFIKSLESHFYRNFRVKVAAMRLERIGTSVVFVGSEGRVKIFSKDHVRQIFRHVTELAIENVVGTQ